MLRREEIIGMKSIEEKVEEAYKKELDKLDVRRWAKNDAPNDEIRQALDNYESKSGGLGRNYPDIQALLDNGSRRIPVMMECKGSRGKLEKLDKNGYIAEDTKSVNAFAVNGALHYGRALQALMPDMKECIVIGMNGSKLAANGKVSDLECKAYYISRENGYEPKHIKELDNDLTLLKHDNLSRMLAVLDGLFLTDIEREAAKRRVEDRLEASIKAIHQSLYDNARMRNLLGMNDKLYLFCGLIMAGLSADGVPELQLSDFKSLDDPKKNDGAVVIEQVDFFLRKKNCDQAKLGNIMGLLKPLFRTRSLWKPTGGVSILRELFLQVKTEVIPHLESPFHLDFTGKILNSLNDWVQIENDKQNDVVLTPRYLTNSMARMCRTDMNSFVWDRAMGSAGFLVSAMDIMIRDATSKIKDAAELEDKIKDIKEKQLLGIEILPNIYLLAVLNMILMGDGSSRLERDDSHSNWDEKFPANVFLLNPPYSAPGKGFNFVAETLEHMTTGYAAILIQENAGAGQGLPYTKRILKNNTLVASIHMPDKLFSGKASVQTAVYVFQINRPHEEDDIVKFIDFTDDGYSRQNRKKSSQEVNLRDTGDAIGRYAEMESLVLGKKPKTCYFTKENGRYIEDCISLDGDDWTFAQHKVIDTVPTEEDFKKTVANYLTWKVSNLMRGEAV